MFDEIACNHIGDDGDFLDYAQALELQSAALGDN